MNKEVILLLVLTNYNEYHEISCIGAIYNMDLNFLACMNTGKNYQPKKSVLFLHESEYTH